MTPYFDLEQFVRAQAPVIDDVKRELAAGHKRTHWMWFVFPQLAGLGHSHMAQRFAIGSLEEAEAYLFHPVLGLRLIECTGLVNKVEGRSIHAIFGSPDDMKFHSSMTLFSCVTGASPSFTAALNKYFDGKRDRATLALLSGGGG
jgi:uncharacterized protein (DUF1810 family)